MPKFIIMSNRTDQHGSMNFWWNGIGWEEKETSGKIYDRDEAVKQFKRLSAALHHTFSLSLTRLAEVN